jgi:hypothetical protein
MPLGSNMRVTTAWPGWAGVLVVALLCFPGEYRPLDTWLDPSWVYGINAAACGAARFGTDFSFTYGPLGFLLRPLDLGANLALATALRLAVHALLLAVLAWRVRRGQGSGVLVFALAYVAAKGLGMTFEYDLLVLAALLAGAMRDEGRLWPFVAPVLGALAGAAPFMRPTLALALGSFLALAAAAALARRLPGARVAALCGLWWCAAVAGMLAVSLFDSAGAFIVWCQASIEITLGFAGAMGIPGPLAWTLAAWGFVALLCLWGWRCRGAAAVLVLAGAPALLISLHHTFDRFDPDHAAHFFPLAAAWCAAATIGTTGRWSRATSVALVIAALLCGAGTLRASGATWTAPFVRQATGVTGMHNLADLARWPATRARLARESTENLSYARLPEEFLAVAKPGAMWDSIPWELSVMPANNLRWQPSPTLQLYSAYTPRLDSLTARHFDGPRAPRYLLYTFVGLDGRAVHFDVPETWRTLLCRYQLAAFHEPAALLLLELHDTPARASIPAPAGTATARPGEWVTVPEDDGLLFAHGHMRPSLAGLALRVFQAPPPVHIELEYFSGARTLVRVVPATVEHGLLVNLPPREAADLAGLFVGQHRDRVARFRFGGEGAALYRWPLVLTYERHGELHGGIGVPRNADLPIGSSKKPDL